MNDRDEQWLAENTMGWTFVARKELQIGGGKCHTLTGHDHYVNMDGDVVCSADYWRPTTDIGQAMNEVVPAMQRKGYAFELFWDDVDALAWFRGKDEESYQGDADTPALAICRAARAAVEDDA